MDAVETDRLVLRNFRATDGADLFAYLRTPRARCFLSLTTETPEAATEESKARSGSDEHIAVCLRTTGQVIGDLFAMLEPPDTFSVGWHFNADFAGAGYASEAVRALFGHLFLHRQAQRLYAYAEVDNHASSRLCERVGMRREGVFREFISFTTDARGHPVYEDTQQFAVLRKEWQADAAGMAASIASRRGPA